MGEDWQQYREFSFILMNQVPSHIPKQAQVAPIIKAVKLTETSLKFRGIGLTNDEMRQRIMSAIWNASAYRVDFYASEQSQSRDAAMSPQSPQEGVLQVENRKDLGTVRIEQGVNENGQPESVAVISDMPLNYVKHLQHVEI